MPKTNDHQIYNRYFSVFESLITKVSDEFDAISDLGKQSPFQKHNYVGGVLEVLSLVQSLADHMGLALLVQL